jgi:hypothetical protein
VKNKSTAYDLYRFWRGTGSAYDQCARLRSYPFCRWSVPPQPLPTLAAEVGRFHEMLVDLAAHLERDTELLGTQPEQLLQGPFADAMTHAGQLAMLRRLAGAPVPPENFIVADMSPERLGQDQPMPVSPDRVWRHHRLGFRRKKTSACRLMVIV